jgi:hypothetical protein
VPSTVRAGAEEADTGVVSPTLAVKTTNDDTTATRTPTLRRAPRIVSRVSLGPSDRGRWTTTGLSGLTSEWARNVTRDLLSG